YRLEPPPHDAAVADTAAHDRSEPCGRVQAPRSGRRPGDRSSLGSSGDLRRARDQRVLRDDAPQRPDAGVDGRHPATVEVPERYTVEICNLHGLGIRGRAESAERGKIAVGNGE